MVVALSHDKQLETYKLQKGKYQSVNRYPTVHGSPIIGVGFLGDMVVSVEELNVIRLFSGDRQLLHSLTMNQISLTRSLIRADKVMVTGQLANVPIIEAVKLRGQESLVLKKTGDLKELRQAVKAISASADHSLRVAIQKDGTVNLYQSESTQLHHQVLHPGVISADVFRANPVDQYYVLLLPSHVKVYHFQTHEVVRSIPHHNPLTGVSFLRQAESLYLLCQEQNKIHVSHLLALQDL